MALAVVYSQVPSLTVSYQIWASHFGEQLLKAIFVFLFDKRTIRQEPQRVRCLLFTLPHRATQSINITRPGRILAAVCTTTPPRESCSVHTPLLIQHQLASCSHPVDVRFQEIWYSLRAKRGKFWPSNPPVLRGDITILDNGS